MQNFITKDQWMLLDIPTKQRLVEVFGLIKSGFSEVRDNYVVTDGYTQEDLKAINLEKMSAYIGSEETFLRAWEITLRKVHFELNPPVGEIKGVDEKTGATVIVEAVPVNQTPIVDNNDVPQIPTAEELANAQTPEATQAMNVPEGTEGNQPVVEEVKEEVKPKTNDTKKSK